MHSYLLILIITTNFAGSHMSEVKFASEVLCEEAKVKSKQLIGGKSNDRITDVRGVCLKLN